jgi:type IV secretion system protein VirB5
MKRPIFVAVLTMATAASGNLHAAGVPVIDTSNLAQAVAQAATLTEQLTALQDQLNTLRAQAATITNMYSEMRGITAHALMLPNPVNTLHDFLPAANLDPSSLLSGPLSGIANSLRDAKEIYSADNLFGSGGTQLTGAARQYRERSDYIYSYMALAKDAYEKVAARRTTLEGFATAAGTATTEKAVLDLNTRIAAENTLLLNDLAQLQALQLMAAMQDKSIVHNSEGMHAKRPTGVGDLDFGR